MSIRVRVRVRVRVKVEVRVRVRVRVGVRVRYLQCAELEEVGLVPLEVQVIIQVHGQVVCRQPTVAVGHL